MSEETSGVGALCFKSPGTSASGALCFCSRQGDDNGKLVFKQTIANVYISWEAPNRDLDICAYWVGNSEGKVGFGWKREVENDTYYLRWYGDNTGIGGTEHLLPRIKPNWNTPSDRTLRVHLNYYPSGGSVTGICSIRVVSADGTDDVVAEGVRCGERGGMANMNDPYVDIVFDENGRCVAINR